MRSVDLVSRVPRNVAIAGRHRRRWMFETINERYATETCRDQDAWQSWSPRNRARHVVRTARARFFHCSTDLAIVVPVRTMLELHVVPSPSSKETVTLLITLFEYTRDVHFSAHFVSTSHLFSPFHPILLLNILRLRFDAFSPSIRPFSRREARYPLIAEIPVDGQEKRYVRDRTEYLSQRSFLLFVSSVLKSQVTGSLEKYRGVHAALEISGREPHSRRGTVAGYDEHTRAVFTHMKRLPFFSLASLSRTERQLRALPAARRANGLKATRARSLGSFDNQTLDGHVSLPPTTSRSAKPLAPNPFPTLVHRTLICLSPFSASCENQPA